MVFFFKIRGGQCLNGSSHINLRASAISCYVGRDKHENEHLIAHGLPSDIWFHVSELSSAHVYFRIIHDPTPFGVPEYIPAEDLPVETLDDLMQITKNNSISGSKLGTCKMVYTEWTNLRKNHETMDTGTISFHNMNRCIYTKCVRNKERVKVLEKTKSDGGDPDFHSDKIKYERAITKRRKAEKVGLRDQEQEKGRQEEIQKQKAVDAEEAAFAAMWGSSRNKNKSKETIGWDGEDEAGAVDADPGLTMKSATPKVQWLAERGHPLKLAKKAMADSKGDKIKALKLLLAQMQINSSSSRGSSGSADEIAAVRAEEKEVLSAIFGEDAAAFIPPAEDPITFDSILPVQAFDPPQRYSGRMYSGGSRFEAPPPLLLEVYADNGVSRYPFEPPVIALSGGGLPKTALLQITTALHALAIEKIAGFSGEPEAILYDLLTLAGEEAQRFVDNETAALDSSLSGSLSISTGTPAGSAAAPPQPPGKSKSNKAGSVSGSFHPNQPGLMPGRRSRSAHGRMVLESAEAAKDEERVKAEVAKLKKLSKKKTKFEGFKPKVVDFDAAAAKGQAARDGCQGPEKNKQPEVKALDSDDEDFDMF